MNDDRLIFVDIETTGLEPLHEVILEVGVRFVSASDLSAIDEFDITVWDSPQYDKRYENMIRDAGYEYVLKMHQASGLWDAARGEGSTLADAEEALIDFVKGHGIENTEAMCGSSIHFDRSFLHEGMPEFERLFSYRNIDVSTLKELCRRYNPMVFEQLDKETNPKKKHRALPDIDDTVEEFRFYHDNFLWVP